MKVLTKATLRVAREKSLVRFLLAGFWGNDMFARRNLACEIQCVSLRLQMPIAKAFDDSTVVSGDEDVVIAQRGEQEFID